MHSEKVGAFRANRTEKVGAFRANKTQKGGLYRGFHMVDPTPPPPPGPKQVYSRTLYRVLGLLNHSVLAALLSFEAMFLLKSKRAVVLFYTNKNIFLLKELNLQVHLPVRCISIQVTNPFIFLSKSQASSCTALYTFFFFERYFLLFVSRRFPYYLTENCGRFRTMTSCIRCMAFMASPIVFREAIKAMHLMHDVIVRNLPQFSVR